MNAMNHQLFEGALVRLVAPDLDHDAEIESKWTHDPEYLRLLRADPVRPLSPHQIKKKYEAEEKDENASRRFHFAIRTRADDRLVGFIRLEHIEWTHGTGMVRMGIGDPNDWGQGYGTEALRLILRYAFAELNLYRITADTCEYNSRAVRFLERAGFALEVRRRQAIHRDGRRWDALKMGLLRQEWETKGNEQ
jgi:RimJ/RimL family protein N-acetyltransferase